MKTAHALAALLLVSCSGKLERANDPTAAEVVASDDQETIEMSEPEPMDAESDPAPKPGTAPAREDAPPAPSSEIATLGAGCFWCIEAVLEQLDGVIDVTSGYTGGQVENPTYAAICTGTTGHAEVVQVTFDPRVLPYAELLDWFWRLHDPTTLNRQGNDIGTQYRSAIYVHSPEQREIAEASTAEAQAAFTRPIVTEITDATTYYIAEEKHQDYYRANKSQGYCRVVIKPKLKKLGLQD